MIEARINQAQLARVEAILRGVPRSVPKVYARALNRAGKNTERRIARGVTKELAVRQRDVTNVMRSTRASQRRQRYAIRISGDERIPLSRFNPTQLRKGVKARVSRREGRKLYTSAFAAENKDLKQGVHTRVRRSRLPITELHGPSILEVFRRHAQRDVEENAAKDLERQVDTALKGEISRLQRRAAKGGRR